MENEKPTRPQSDVPDVVDSNPINLSSSQPRGSINNSSVTQFAISQREYDTNHAKRGIAVIFNQVNFKNLEKRNGSDKDCDSMHKTLIHLGFDVRVHKDSKQSEIKNELTTIANEDHSNNDCFLLVIMTHGEENTLHASDKIFEQNLLWENFTGANCPTLIGKPKLFFIQACRGRSFDGGVQQPLLFAIAADTVDAKSTAPSFTIPDTADLLVMYSTFEDHYSWRNSKNGSWFIQTLSTVLRTKGNSDELMQLLKLVQRHVAYEYQSNVPHNQKMDAKKQMPCFMTTITKDFYFRPKNQ